MNTSHKAVSEIETTLINGSPKSQQGYFEPVKTNSKARTIYRKNDRISQNSPLNSHGKCTVGNCFEIPDPYFNPNKLYISFQN